MAKRIRMIIDAEKFAKEKHKHQFRDDGTTPYSKHLEKVVEILNDLGINDDVILCAGWLHDTIEDTDTDYDDIDDKFGTETADIVATLTKDTRMIKQKREIDYCTQLSKGAWKSQIVKFADILANLEDLKNSTNNDANFCQNQAQNKLEYYDSIKSGLQENKKDIPRLDSQIKRLSDVFLQYGVRI